MCQSGQTEVRVVQGGGHAPAAEIAPQLSVGKLFLITTMNFDVDEINAATRLISQAERAVGYGSGITPTNGEEWRHRFLAGWAAGRPVNPQFEYTPAVRDDAAQAIDLAWAALPEHHQWRPVLARELSRLASALQALTTRDPSQQTDYAGQQFGVPTAADRQSAERFLEAHPRESIESASVSADAVLALVRTVLADAGLVDWRAEGRAHMAARMSVVGARRVVRVRRDAVFWPAEVRRLMIHEIGTHLVRSANGQRQRLRILGYGITGYLPTEEGLAVWHEQLSGASDVNVMRRYALRVIASHAALTGDFCTVFATLREYTDPDEAYTMTLRVKRGLLDTGAPGGHIKDHVYRMGAQLVGAHLGQHPEDHELLLATKWPLTEIETLRAFHRAGIVARPEYRIASFVELIDAAIANTTRGRGG